MQQPLTQLEKETVDLLALGYYRRELVVREDKLTEALECNDHVAGLLAKWSLLDILVAINALQELYVQNVHAADACFAPLFDLFSTSTKPLVVFRGMHVIHESVDIHTSRGKVPINTLGKDVLLPLLHTYETDRRTTSSWSSDLASAVGFTGSSGVVFRSEPRFNEIVVVPPGYTHGHVNAFLNKVLTCQALTYRALEHEVVLCSTSVEAVVHAFYRDEREVPSFPRIQVWI